MPAIKVLGICGSPRKGNSHFLLTKAIEGAKSVGGKKVETEFYSLRGNIFQPCRACSYCGKNSGRCAIKDDFEELREKWLAADVILYSVPIYHMGIPGQLKCFIDRLGNSMFGVYRLQLAEKKDTLPKLQKVVGCIVQGMHIFAGQEHTITSLINHALVMQCIPVAGDLWESYIGCGGWTQNDIERDGLEKLAAKDEVSAAATVRAAAAIGRRCVEMAMIIRAGVLVMRDILKSDPLYQPLLDRLEEKDKSRVT
jgi:multimeric flavodoxin WrbA